MYKALSALLFILACAEPMQAAVAFGTQTSSNFASTASPTVNAPASLANGDLIVVMFGLNDSVTQGGAPTLNGFTACTPTSAIDGGIHALYKIASGEGASWTFTNLWTAASTGVYGSARFSGVDSGAPLDGLGCNATAAAGGTATPITASVTPNGDGRMFVAMWGGDNGAGFSGTAGCTAACTGSDPVATEAIDAVDPGDGEVYMEYYLQTTAAAEDLNFTADASRNYSSYLFILNPATGGGGSHIENRLRLRQR